MSTIAPFRAIRYNKAKIPDLFKVVSPPYDIISPEQLSLYSNLSPYNIVHLTLPGSKKDKHAYSQAAATFRNWLKKKILIQEEKPAIYFYEQRFMMDNQQYKRLGFIANLNLTNKSIFSHEHTRIEPKEDRLKLQTELHANLEPIFVLFSDPQACLQRIFKKTIAQTRVFTAVTDAQKTENYLWKVTSPFIIKEVLALIEKKHFLIADGHHRYEVALRYRQQMLKKRTEPLDSARDKLCRSANEPFNYVLAYFCPLQSKGLLVSSSINLKEILRLAKLGKKMPPKSTYFYPKVLSGLVINRL
ncbi:MAG: DUF1015 domain-containing protein [Candidatus Omnitrophica bacterium]|nr:DUF1015 domain-containing protein [Candidatus Omnitrophota bacterium]